MTAHFILLKFSGLIPPKVRWWNHGKIHNQKWTGRQRELLEKHTRIFIESGAVLTGKELLGLSEFELQVLHKVQEEIRKEKAFWLEMTRRLEDEELQEVSQKREPLTEEEKIPTWIMAGVVESLTNG